MTIKNAARGAQLIGLIRQMDEAEKAIHKMIKAKNFPNSCRTFDLELPWLAVKFEPKHLPKFLSLIKQINKEYKDELKSL